MLKNKIMALAIGILSFAVVGNSQTLRSDTGPAEVPPASFKGKQYVDSKGCVYIRAGYGTRITWVPRVNRERRVFCSPRNKPSLSPTQLAAITGEPATRLVKPTVKTTTPVKPITPKKTVRTAVAKPVITPQAKPLPAKKQPGLLQRLSPKRTPTVKPAPVVRSVPTVTTPVAKPTTTVAAVTPRKVKSNTKIWGQRPAPQPVHPSDLFRQKGPVVQGGTTYNIASAAGQEAEAPVLQGGTAYNIGTATPERARRANSVRGYSLFARRKNREALRRGPQAVHPVDVIRARQSSGTYQQAYGVGSTKPVARSTDPIHNLTLYPTVIASDVTPRGDAQMAQVWANTVPRTLIKKRRVKLVAPTMSYTVSTKSGDYTQDISLR